MRHHIARTPVRRTVNLRRLTATLVAALMTTTSVACDRLLDVENPARVPTEALDNPALMQTLESASIQQFQCACITAFVAMIAEDVKQVRCTNALILDLVTA